MIYFLGVSVALFSAIHLIPALPELKKKLQARFGKAYGPGFGIAATATLLLIVLAWSQLPFEAVYEPYPWGRHANLLASLIAFCFVGIFFFRGKLRQFFRFPFAIAILFWATGHLLANGDRASIVLFGGLLVYALVYIMLALANKVFPSLEVRDGHDVLSLVFGVAAYIGMVQLHPVLIGVPVITIKNVFGG